MNQTIAIAIITALAAIIPTIINAHNSTKGKKLDLANAVKLQQYKQATPYYIAYIETVFACINNQTEENYSKCLKAYYILLFTLDGITGKQLQKVQDCVSNKDFDSALAELEHLTNMLNLFVGNS